MNRNGHYTKTIKQRIAVPLVCLLCVVFQPANAELLLLDDSTMAKVTGRSGLTIDIETMLTIAEIEYVDEGSMVWKDISLTGIGGGLLDNLRAKVDSTDGNETIAVGFSEVAMYADLGYFDASEADVAWAIAEYADGSGGYGKQFGDGDAIIHVTSQDMGIDLSVAPNPADYAANLQAYKNAVDLHYQEGMFGLRSSDGSVETALSENFSVEAYLGYFDIILKNNGNGRSVNTSPGAPRNIRIGDSYVGLDVKFRVEDLDIDRTNNATNTFIPREVTNPGLTLRNMRIHNERGNDTEGSFGFASVESKIAAADGILSGLASNTMAYNGGNVVEVDGQAIYDINVRWDWDLPHIQFGDTPTSIGAVYFTDFNIYDTSIVISAH